MTSGGRDSGPGGGPALDTEFTWDCPFCGKSRTKRSTEEDGAENAVTALRSHIISSDGGGHGPRNELPADSELPLLEYVYRVDGRRRDGVRRDGR